MLIDWFTVAAQIINFLVLVVLLKVFLFDRIVAAMDQREERIASRLQQAEKREQQAAEQADKLQAERDELEKTRRDRIDEIEAEVDARRDELLEQARKDVNEQREQWRGSAREEQQQFLDDLRRRSAAQIQAAVRLALEDLANAELEQQIVNRFVAQLKELDPESAGKMRTMLQDAGGAEAVTVVTGFELDEKQRERVLDAVADALGARPAGGVETDSELVCGIECRANGMSVGWSVETWLQKLSAEMSRILDDQIGTTGERGDAEQHDRAAAPGDAAEDDAADDADTDDAGTDTADAQQKNARPEQDENA